MLTKPILDIEPGNRVVEDIKETEDLVLPDIYARDYSIRIEAGVNRFCGFIDLETTHRLSVIYRVNLIWLSEYILNINILTPIFLSKTMILTYVHI